MAKVFPITTENTARTVLAERLATSPGPGQGDWPLPNAVTNSVTNAASEIRALEFSMFLGGTVEPEDILALWSRKSVLDIFFDLNLGNHYTKVRDALFVQDQHGSHRFYNRAGDKLHEVLVAAEIAKNRFYDKDPIYFVDLCGGPGAFSQVLLSSSDNNINHGYGITLRGRGADRRDDWYPELLAQEDHFTPVWGSTGTGDVFVEENLLALQDQVLASGRHGISYAVADGGFNVSTVTVEGHVIHVEHLQELYSNRLILSELYGALLVLKRGGHFVCKLFDTFSEFSISLLYVVSMLFEHCSVIKPFRSRAVNSERYLAGKTFRRDGLFELLFPIIQDAYRRSANTTTPGPLLPLDWFDNVFFESVALMNSTLLASQISALDQIIRGLFEDPPKRNPQRWIDATNARLAWERQTEGVEAIQTATIARLERLVKLARRLE